LASPRHTSLAALVRTRLLALVLRLAPIAPHQISAMYPLAGVAGYWLAPAARAAVSDNLHHLFPDAAPDRVRALSRAIFRSAMRFYLEMLTLPNRRPVELEAALRVRGFSHVLAAQQRGRGVIVAGIHQGPTEIALQAFAARGMHYTAVVERLESPAFAALMRRIRESSGNQYVHPDAAGARALLRTLRQGGVVALLVDRDVTGSGLEVSFCNGSIRAPRGVFTLARATDAAIIPAHAHWAQNGSYTVELLAPFEPAATGGPDAERLNLEALLRVFEPYLRRYPEQWLVLSRLWR
jgi:lauroyl/myristoyl acyltransferase